MTAPVSPTREDGVARAASAVVGGPAGRHVGGSEGPWTPVVVLGLLGTAVLGLAVLTRQHCRATLWASPDQFTHACYSDVPALFVSSGLDRGVVPYLEAAGGAYLAQPVGTGGLLGLLTWVAPSGPDAVRWVFDLGVLVLAVALVATVAAVVSLAGRRPWDAALVALSPVVVTASLVSLDLVAVALATVGVAAFARSRPALAGVLLGLAVAVRPLGLVVLVALCLLALRTDRWSSPGRTLVWAALAWLAVNVPVLALSPEGWAAYWTSLASAPVGYGSVWLLPQLAGYPLDAVLVRWLSAGATLLVVLAVGVLALAAPRRPRLPALVLVLLVGVLLVAVSVPVQASLWLLPFAALAVPRWRDHLLWAGTEVVYATVTWLYLYAQSVPERGIRPSLYAALLLLRLAAMAWLAYQALRSARDPALDPVRSPRDAPGLARDDPAAGDLEDAPDALVVRIT